MTFGVEANRILDQLVYYNRVQNVPSSFFPHEVLISFLSLSLFLLLAHI